MHWCDIVLFFAFSGDASSSEGEIKPPQRLGIICLLHVLVKCRMSSICITSVCCCERTKISKVKTDEKLKKLKLKRCAFSTGVVSSVPLYKKVYAELVWLRGTGKLYDNSQNVLDSEKNTPSFFLINYMQCLILTRYLTT